MKRNYPAAPGTIGLLLILALIAILWRFDFFSGARSPERDDRRPALRTSAMEAEEASGIVKEADRPAYRKHGAMFYLQFEYASGQISLHRAQQLEGTVKPIRSLRGMSGFYYRSLSLGGVALADGVIPDPRFLPYSFPETGDPDGTIRAAEAGRVPLEETEFVITLPVTPEPAVAIEIFTVSAGEADRSEFALPANRLGRFELGGG